MCVGETCVSVFKVVGGDFSISWGDNVPTDTGDGRCVGNFDH